MSDSALVAEYESLKQLAYTAAAVKSRSLGRLLKDLDLVIAIARKRGLKLNATKPEGD
jgi:hypothetical protein